MKKKVLIQCGDLIENHERILSCCIQLRYMGFTPLALVYLDNGSFFRQFSIDYIRLVENYPNGREQLEISDAVHEDVRTLERLRQGATPDSFSKKNIHNVMYACNAIITSNEIDLIFVWNGHTGVVANCLRVIKESTGLPGGYMERGLLKNTIFFDTKGVNGASILAKGSEELGHVSTNIDQILVEELQFEKKTFRENFSKSKNKAVFIPLQVQGDTNIILYSKNMKLMRNLILEGITLAKRLGDDWKVIVRPHPEEDSSVDLNIPNDPNVITRSDAQLYDEILDSSVVLTINSTVGLEASALGRYVITCGDGIYTAERFARSLSSVCSDDFDIRKDVDSFYNDCDNHFLKIKTYLQLLLSQFHFIPRRYKALFPESTILGVIRENIKEYAAKNTDDLGDMKTRQIFDALSSISDNGNSLYIDVFINANDKVNITYRKFDMPVDKSFIENKIRFYTGHEEICANLNLTPKNQIRSDIAIFPTDFKGEEPTRYHIVFDEKMNIHPSALKAAYLGKKQSEFKILERDLAHGWGLNLFFRKLAGKKIGSVTLKRRIARLRRKYIG